MSFSATDLETIEQAMLWTVALSVLGITVTKRSKDKEVAAGVTAAPGIIQTIMNGINHQKDAQERVGRMIKTIHSYFWYNMLYQ